MTIATPWEDVMPLLVEAVAPYPPGPMRQLAARGYDTVYHQLVDCILSIRTLGEVSTPISLAIFERAGNWEELATIEPELLAEIVKPARFAEQKKETLLDIACTVVSKFGGELPADYETLVSLKGVGPKCANAVLAIAGGMPSITIDSHVHRVINRWGVVRTAMAEQDIKPMQAWIPKRHWDDLNRLVQPFGKHICTYAKPRCEVCPLTMWCHYYREVISRKHKVLQGINLPSARQRNCRSLIPINEFMGYKIYVLILRRCLRNLASLPSARQ